MADRAGSLVALRVNGGPVTIKVTDYEYDPEIKENRAVTSDANQNARTVLCSISGKVTGTGYVDPGDSGVALMLAGASSTIGTSQDLTTVKFMLDISETGGSRHGWSMGTCKLIIRNVGGSTEENGMTKVNFEIHSQAGSSYSSSLT